MFNEVIKVSAVKVHVDDLSNVTLIFCDALSVLIAHLKLDPLVILISNDEMLST
ncbi:hypothetical protein IJL65_03580 [bacterium]|nr:hypothetical protein [bacterium]